jgi:hypothetical protein
MTYCHYCWTLNSLGVVQQPLLHTTAKSYGSLLSFLGQSSSNYQPMLFPILQYHVLAWNMMIVWVENDILPLLDFHQPWSRPTTTATHHCQVLWLPIVFPWPILIQLSTNALSHPPIPCIGLEYDDCLSREWHIAITGHSIALESSNNHCYTPLPSLMALYCPAMSNPMANTHPMLFPILQ